MRVLVILIVLLFSLGLTGCAEKTIVAEEPPAVVVIPLPVDMEVPEVLYTFRWDNADFTSYLVEALEGSELTELNPDDGSDFGDMKDPVKFWGNILVEMAYYESHWKTTASYKESFGVWSRGLFQLSAVDGPRYNCNFTTEDSVHDAKANIDCAVKVMTKLVKQNGRIAGYVSGKWQGGARYWSVLRGTRDYTKKALIAIKGANK